MIHLEYIDENTQTIDNDDRPTSSTSTDSSISYASVIPLRKYEPITKPEPLAQQKIPKKSRKFGTGVNGAKQEATKSVYLPKIKHSGNVQRDDTSHWTWSLLNGMGNSTVVNLQNVKRIDVKFTMNGNRKMCFKALPKI